MENNEELTLEVIETTEAIVEKNSMDVLKATAGVGLVVLGGIAAYKYIYKPMKEKRKAKKEQTTANDEDIIDIEIDDQEVHSEEE